MASRGVFRHIFQNLDTLTCLKRHCPGRTCVRLLATCHSKYQMQWKPNVSCVDMIPCGQGLNTYTQVRHKGHSHFQNIRANKAANDNAKMRAMAKLSTDMAIAVREGGGTDPKLNNRLTKVMKAMEAQNIPKTRIAAVLEKIKDAGKSPENTFVEVKGPSGAVFVAEMFSMHPKTAGDQVRSAMKKVPGTKVSELPKWLAIFDKIGVITVPVTKGMDGSSTDAYLEVAIESGAEDVILVPNTDEDIEAETVLKFYCDHRQLAIVEKEISQTHDLNVSSSEVDLVPKQWMDIGSEDHLIVCEAIVERLNKIEDVIKVYDNISAPEE